MNPTQLLQHFDRISDAPDAIPRLRRFILDLAVRGKLVEQDPRDEPASELLTRIQKEKALLVKAGKLKLLDPVLEISDQEKPFSTPSSWAWARLANTSRRIHYGFTASANQSLKTVRLLRITDIQNNSVDWSSVPGCEITADEVAQYRLDEKDILIARTGGTIGKTFLVRQIPVTAVFASYLIRVQPSAELHAQYLKVFLESSVYWEQLQDGARGGGQPNVNGQTLGRMILPIPPRSEQYRIVIKVDELMALCDRLEATQRERESRRDRLAASSLHRLNNGADPDAFRDHARFYFNHLPRLTTQTEHIQQLRQAILNLAVRGKLVPQDPKDEPVAFAEIPLAKKSDGRVSRDNLEDDAWPDNIPESWRWYRLGAISQQITDGEHATPPRIIEQQVPLVTAKNVRNGFMDYDDTDWVSSQTASKAWSRCRPAVGDILLVCVGATTGRLCVLREARDMVLVRSVALIRPCLAIDVYYLALALRSPMCQTQIWGKVKVTAQPCLYIHRIKSLPIPIPPLAEQRRIVAKVEELMTVCDRLEAQLTTTQTESRRLLEAVLQEALAGRCNFQEMAL